jgi:hypothetical protein
MQCGPFHRQGLAESRRAECEKLRAQLWVARAACEQLVEGVRRAATDLAEERAGCEAAWGGVLGMARAAKQAAAAIAGAAREGEGRRRHERWVARPLLIVSRNAGPKAPVWPRQ